MSWFAQWFPTKRKWSQLSIFLCLIAWLAIIVGAILVPIGLSQKEDEVGLVYGQLDFSGYTMELTYPWMPWVGGGLAVLGLLVVIGITLSRPYKVEVTA